jgi:hypothetical protein
MYTVKNFKTKKELKAAVASGPVECFQPGLGTVPTSGTTAVCGPHYPMQHRWYASVEMRDGRIVKVLD